jgi:hypothetical protein
VRITPSHVVRRIQIGEGEGCGCGCGDDCVVCARVCGGDRKCCVGTDACTYLALTLRWDVADMCPPPPLPPTRTNTTCALLTRYSLLSRRWLALAESLDTPPAVDNRDFVCPHGRFVIAHSFGLYASLCRRVVLWTAHASSNLTPGRFVHELWSFVCVSLWLCVTINALATRRLTHFSPVADGLVTTLAAVVVGSHPLTHSTSCPLSQIPTRPRCDACRSRRGGPHCGVRCAHGAVR